MGSLHFFLVLLFLTEWCGAGKVLFIPPFISPSHRLPMLPWADELSSRGHEVLMWSPTLMAETSYKPKKAKVDEFLIPSEHMALEKLMESELKMIWDFDWNANGGASEAAFGYIAALEGCEYILTHMKEKIDYVLEEEWDLVIIGKFS